MASPPDAQGPDFEPGVASAIALHFEGDSALYQAFAAACATQFALDALAGQAACEAGDLPALRRLAHNLKSALTMLGRDDVCELASLVEVQAAAGNLGSACASWRSLHSTLLRLRSP